MTDPIDLEALRAALKLIDEAISEADRAMPTPLNRRGESTRHPVHHAEYAGELRQARVTVAAALAELTTRRARDAEVAELVAAAEGAAGWLRREGMYCACGARSCRSGRLTAALLPFQRSDDKGDAT